MIQLPMFQPTNLWKPPVVSQLPSWAGAKRVCVDLETKDPHLTTLGIGVRRGGRVIGVSFKIEDGPGAYMPIGHFEDNIDAGHVWNYMRDQAAVFKGDIVGANLSYDLDYLWENGVRFDRAARHLDIQVAETLIDELQMKYSMEAIAERRGIPGKDEVALREAAKAWGVDPKKEMWKLPARFVGGYAEQDTMLPLQLLRRQERDIEEQELGKIFDIETKLTPILLKMRRRGVLIDQKHLQRIEDWSIEQQTIEHKKIYAECGYKLGLEDIDKSKAKAQALRASGISDIPQTANTKKDSVDKFFLEIHAKKGNKVAAAMLRASKVAKLRNTFVDSIRRHMVNGRIHCTFNQLRRSSDSENEDDTGARYGRLSCVDPNLQQQPARDPEIGKFWRKIYIPDNGMMWSAKDYSQQEPRLTIHYATLAKCSGAAEYAERFRRDLTADSHTEMTKLCWGDDIVKQKTFKQFRGYAKEIFLGVTYGMGGAKLCRKLNKPTEWKFIERMGKRIEVAGPEGQAILDEVDRRMPFLRQLAKLCEARAKAVGFVKTLLGRRCRFPRKDDGTVDWAHKALNRVIQGSAADQTKFALVTADEQGWVSEDTNVPGLQLQVHDEMDGSMANKEQAEQVADIMRNCVQLLVPSKVDVELGDSWGDSMGD